MGPKSTRRLTMRWVSSRLSSRASSRRSALRQPAKVFSASVVTVTSRIGAWSKTCAMLASVLCMRARRVSRHWICWVARFCCKAARTGSLTLVNLQVHEEAAVGQPPNVAAQARNCSPAALFCQVVLHDGSCGSAGAQRCGCVECGEQRLLDVQRLYGYGLPLAAHDGCGVGALGQRRSEQGG